MMDIEKLKAEHPGIYAQAVAVGVDQGVSQERKRCDAHLTMGKASKDMPLAVQCITDGVEHDAASNAKYMASQMNSTAIDDRAGESEADLNLDPEASADTDDAELATATAKLLGVEQHA